MKYCYKGHENPDEANFCRFCGVLISQTHKDGDFTLTKFKGIKLVPVQHHFFAPASFWAFWVLAFILVIVASVATYFNGHSEFLEDGPTFILVTLLFVILPHPYWRFHHNVDFIEDTKSDIKRIAKDCKLGLYNSKKKKILLGSRYDEIERVDDVHYTIQRNGKYGIYSIAKKRLIVPVRFDRVSQQYEGVWTAEKKGKVSHYNYSGKIVK